MLKPTHHAEIEMRRRAIRWDWIEATVSAPDWIEADADPMLTRSFRSIAEFGGRVLRVVHRPDGADTLVVTAFFDRGARR